MSVVIDAHHHLWDPARRHYPWLAAAGLEDLRRRFDLHELTQVSAAAGVSHTVLVQTVSEVAETQEFLAAAANSGELIRGVVGWADLQASADGRQVVDQVEQYRRAPGGPLLVGLRHQVEDETDPDWLLQPAVRHSIGAATGCGLIIDLLVRTDQLPAAAAVADENPNARFVLDHGAKPPIGTSAWPRWAAAVADLARRENVVAKLSGLFTLTPSLTQLHPSLDHLLECFGPERLLFGTDWPVSTLAASYVDVIERTASLLAALSSAERRAIFGANAAAVYDLSVSTTSG